MGMSKPSKPQSVEPSEGRAGTFRAIRPAPPAAPDRQLYSPSGSAFVVALASASGEPAAAQLEAFARIMDADPYSARARLAMPAPSPLAVFATEAEAAALLRRLAAEGIRAFLLPEAAAHRIACVPATRLAPDRKALLFDTAEGAFAVRPREVLAVASATLQVRQTTERFTHSHAEARTERTTEQGCALLDVHLATRDAALRIDSRAFDFAGLYPGHTPAPIAMMASMKEWLRTALPGVPFHDQFDVVRERLGITRVRERNVELRAVALERPLAGLGHAEETRQVTETDADAFDRYSLLARFEARALNLKPKQPASAR
jgi:hypothetical protein